MTEPRFVAGPVLGLEATGSLTGAALFRRGRLASEISQDARASSAELLLDQVRRLLESHSLSPRELARIGVSQGPGSFTGLRVALAAARGLAFGAGLPVVGVPSHQALAWSARGLGRSIVLMTGMRRGQIYLEAGRWDGDFWSAHLAGGSVPVEEVLPLVSALPEAGRLIFMGEAVESGCAVAPELRELGDFLLDPLSGERRPATIACLAARVGVEELREDRLESLEPLYLRGADARRPTVA